MPIGDPTDVAGCILWVDANNGVYNDAGSTLATNGQTVQQWNDQSGAGNHLTQGTSTNRPTLVTNVWNGNAVIRFDGNDNYLDLPNFLSGLTAGEAFIVVKIDADPPGADAQTGLWEMGGATPFATHFPYTNNEVYDDFGSTTRKSTGTGYPDLSSAFRVYNVSSSTGDWTNRVDGSQIYSTATNLVGFNTAPKLGKSYGSYYLDGDVVALLVYNAVLSGGTDRADVLDWLQNLTPGGGGGTNRRRRLLLSKGY